MSRKRVCCGEERATPFCPMCGKKLYEHPLSELLITCRDSSEKEAEKAKEYAKKLAGPNRGFVIAEVRKKQEVAEAAALKWAQQAIFLEAMMKYASEKELWDVIEKKSENGRAIHLSRSSTSDHVPGDST